MRPSPKLLRRLRLPRRERRRVSPSPQLLRRPTPTEPEAAEPEGDAPQPKADAPAAVDDFEEDGRADQGLDFVVDVLTCMRMDCTVDLMENADEDPASDIRVEISGKDADRLIGKKGQTFVGHAVPRQPRGQSSQSSAAAHSDRCGRVTAPGVSTRSARWPSASASRR